MDVLSSAGGTTAASKSIEYWIGLKAVSGAAAVRAHTYPKVGGDDLAKDGDYSNSTSNDVTLEDGDIVYGAFDSVIVSSGYLIAYRGR